MNKQRKKQVFSKLEKIELGLEKTEFKLDKIEHKLTQVFTVMETSKPKSLKRDNITKSNNSSKNLETLPDMTPKQHASMQMLLRGADNNEIGKRFNVSPNTAKVYVRSIAKKLGVNARAQIVVKLLDVFNDVDPKAYAIMSHGLPKDWDENYVFPDPYAKLYRVEREDDDS